MHKTALTLIGCLFPAVTFAQSGIVSDDFSSATLGAHWTHLDPLGDTSLALEGFGTDDAQVVISLPPGQSHDLWTDANHAPRLLQDCNDTDFEVVVKYESVVSNSYTSQGIVVQESMDNLLRFEFLYTPNGENLFSAAVGDFPSALLVQDLIPGSPAFLKVQRTGDNFCVQYSYDGTAYVNCAMIHYPLNVTQIGMHATSVAFGAPAPAFESRIDYFFNTASPIEPEDDATDSEIPVANAGSAQAIHAGSVVALDGSASTDDVTATSDLIFAWTLIGVPTGSSASLAGADSIAPTFLADVPGVYTAELVVTDGAGFTSDPSTVDVSSENLAPIAVAGSDDLIALGANAVLDGIDSFDPDGDSIEFGWAFSSIPAGSAVVLLDGDTATPSFSPDLAGDYVLSLVVSDDFSDSDPDEVVVTAVEGNGVAVDRLRDLARDLRWEPSSKFRHWVHKYWLRHQVRRAAKQIDRGKIQRAQKRLNRMILRTDGCVLRGAPDAYASHGYYGHCHGQSATHKPDTVTDCDLQAQVYDTLGFALDIIGGGN